MAKKMAAATKARKAQQKVQKTAKLGSGARFAAVQKAAKAGGAKNPQAVAASVMWKKYGKKKGSALIAKGKKGPSKKK